DLDEAVGLPKERGAEVPQADGEVEQEGCDAHADVASEDEDGDARVHEPVVGEHEEEGAEEQLVGDGIEELSDEGALLKPARKQAVHRVSAAGHEEEGEGVEEAMLEHGDDE